MATELNVSEETTYKWQNHSLVTNKYAPTLYIKVTINKDLLSAAGRYLNLPFFLLKSKVVILSFAQIGKTLRSLTIYNYMMTAL